MAEAVPVSLNVWLATTGETLPIDGERPRLWRTGMVAQELHRRGHQVTWWTSDFVHTSKEHRRKKSAVIDYAPRYRIRLLPSCGYRSHVSVRRIVDHRQVAKHFTREADGEGRPDVIIACYPTIELCSAILKYARRHRVPLAMDVRDAWPDIFEQAAPACLRPAARLLLSPYQWYAGRVLRGADSLISLTPSFLDWALRKAGRKRSETDYVIPMTYSAEAGNSGGSLMDPFLRQHDVDPIRHIVICLFCTFGRQFDIATIIAAAKRIEGQGVNDVRWVLCGDGDGLSEYRQAASGLKSVSFTGWLRSDQIAEILSISSIGLAPYIPERNFHGNIPNKPVEYMSAGLPILTCLEGELTRLVCAEDIGFVYRAEDPASLVKAVEAVRSKRSALKAMGKSARYLFEKRFHPSVVLSAYHDAVVQIAERGVCR